MWRDCENSQLGERRSASSSQGQYGCHGENDAARSRGVRENHGMKPRPSAEYKLIRKSRERVKQMESRMNNPAQNPSYLNRREALQTVALTTAAAANSLTGAARAATPTINVSDRNAGGFWPNGARLAVSLSLMFEGGGQPISGAGGVIPDPIEKGVPDLPTNAFFAYGHYEGIPRVLDLMDKHGIKLSSFMIGKAVETSP